MKMQLKPLVTFAFLVQREEPRTGAAAVPAGLASAGQVAIRTINTLLLPRLSLPVLLQSACSGHGINNRSISN